MKILGIGCEVQDVRSKDTWLSEGLGQSKRRTAHFPTASLTFQLLLIHFADARTSAAAKSLSLLSPFYVLSHLTIYCSYVWGKTDLVRKSSD